MRPRRAGSQVITLVGDDPAGDQLPVTRALAAGMQARGQRSVVVSTGPGAMELSGGQVAIEDIIGDFMAGAVEDDVVAAAEAADWVFVEGRGSLTAPSWSGVALAVLHGSSPDGLVVVHRAARGEMGQTVREIQSLVRVVEEAVAWVKPVPVLGIALDTSDLSEAAARETIRRAAEATGMASGDPVRSSAEPLIEAIMSARGSPAI